MSAGGFFLTSQTVGMQLQNAKFLLSQLRNQSGGLMFPTPADLDKQTIVQHTLRSEVKLNTTSTNFTFNVNVQSNNGGMTFPTENRLGINDIFVCVDFNISVAKPASDTDSDFQLHNYGDPTIFTSAGTSAAVNAMYNKGYIEWQNKNAVVAPHWDLQKHFVIPEVQAQPVPGYSTNATPIISAYNGAIDGFYPTAPNWIFNGAGDIKLKMILSSALAATETFQRLVAQFRGFLLQNSSQVQ